MPGAVVLVSVMRQAAVLGQQPEKNNSLGGWGEEKKSDQGEGTKLDLQGVEGKM